MGQPDGFDGKKLSPLNRRFFNRLRFPETPWFCKNNFGFEILCLILFQLPVAMLGLLCYKHYKQIEFR